MENISLIASIISALTALTTSLRGLGRSREGSALDMEAIRSSARLSGIKAETGRSSSSNFFIYRLSTFIWFMLSMLFAAPSLLRYMGESSSGIMIWASSFTVLAAVLLLIWRKIKT